VAGYEALKALDWLDDQERLKELIVGARVGLYNKRTAYLWDLKEQFFACPQSFYRADDETWTQWRDRLIKRVSGLGLAKVSFALEMSFPQDCGVVCLDTHILRVFGMDNKLHFNSQPDHRKMYEGAEQEWLASCQKLGYPSFMARQVYWDQVQGRSDSRYWSYVLEN
jgi:thermostable 8-oxoguanine DNA glycosylase